MRELMGTTLMVVAAMQASAALTELSAQSGAERGKGGVTHACSLLSVAEVRTITGRADVPDDTFGDDPGEGVGGGSSCNYGGDTWGPGEDPPRVAVILIPKQSARERFDSYRSLATKRGHEVQRVSGVGDDAFAYADEDNAYLWVMTGGHGVTIVMEIVPPATSESLRPTAVALAKAAAAKLR